MFLTFAYSPGVSHALLVLERRLTVIKSAHQVFHILTAVRLLIPRKWKSIDIPNLEEVVNLTASNLSYENSVLPLSHPTKAHYQPNTAELEKQMSSAYKYIVTFKVKSYLISPRKKAI